MKTTLRQYYNLLDAIKQNKYQFVQEWYDSGIDLMANNNEPLKCAIRFKSFETVEELLRFVEPNIGSRFVGGGALSHAIREGLPDLVEMLLVKGARTESITSTDWARSLLESGTFYTELCALVDKYRIIQNN